SPDRRKLLRFGRIVHEKADTLAYADDSQGRRSTLDRGGGIDRGQVQLQRARLQFGHIQQVVDQRQQTSRGVAHARDLSLLTLVERPGQLSEQDVDIASDGSQWRA